MNITKVLTVSATSIMLISPALSAQADNTRTQIIATMTWWDWDTYISTIMKDPSTPMPLEWEIQWEVCGPVKIDNFPEHVKKVILAVFWDQEMVRECTREDTAMDNI